MTWIFDESLTEEEKEYYRRELLDTYEPKEFNRVLYKLLNCDEKESVIDSENDIQRFEESYQETCDMMDLADMQQARFELKEFEQIKMEVYHDYV
ncbi:hypothetical protein [Staphylococcus warneri]|uniref:hypothetical protein n=1 Tax=Staphylococcus warneri TaxID=1292 RepID=UPI0010722CAA|nr:hypothetical protein [Staphylococcus warneri]MBF0770573.1 hypothetical protein [Staphylococcus warneri]TFU64026.1 hypothetical protein E4T90_12880 [Staphylococcus warneri]